MDKPRWLFVVFLLLLIIPDQSSHKYSYLYNRHVLCVEVEAFTIHHQHITSVGFTTQNCCWFLSDIYLDIVDNPIIIPQH